jgi:lysophospholipase L1-like esterase
MLMMRLLSPLLVLACSINSSSAGPTSRAAKPPFILLIGDSTVNSNGGWGDGLLSYLKDASQGENRAKGGSTTVSWRAEGRWEKLVARIQTLKAKYEPIVTIQFGHNDQKSMSLDAYESNLVTLAVDIENLGATPVFISSLARRKFKNDEIVRDLKDWRDRMWNAAKTTGFKFIDLNTASTSYLAAIGPQNAARYNRDADDITHLNSAGQAVFGRMTLDLLLQKRESLKSYFNENKALSDKIKNGEFATG